MVPRNSTNRTNDYQVRGIYVPGMCSTAVININNDSARRAVLIITERVQVYLVYTRTLLAADLQRN